VVVEREGEPTALIDSWNGAQSLWLVDAVSSDAPPGTVHRFDASNEALPASTFRTSTHHFSLGETIELARALGRLPSRTVVYGIEGESFATGDVLSVEVTEAAMRAAQAIREEVTECTRRR
jgi:hydrogenase maturation protease